MIHDTVFLLNEPSRIVNAEEEKTLTQPGDLQVWDGKVKWYPVRGIKIASIIASVGDAPAGGSVLLDVLKNGTSILGGTFIEIPAGSTISPLLIPSTQDIIVGDYLTVNVSQIGPVEPGSNMVLRIVYRKQLSPGEIGPTP